MDFQVWNGSNFLENFLAFRMVHVGGRLGSGKTLLAVALAKWLFEQDLVAGVFANFPIDADYIPLRREVRSSAVILDESWSFADSRHSSAKFMGYGAYARKLDCYWLSPSIFAPDKRMAPVRARREFDLYLFDSWLYRWQNVEGDKSWFILRNYQNLFGRFDSRYIPLDDGGILESLRREIAVGGGSTRGVLRG